MTVVSGSDVWFVLSESFIHVFIYILNYFRKWGILYQMIGSELIRLLCENCANLTMGLGCACFLGPYIQEASKSQYACVFVLFCFFLFYWLIVFNDFICNVFSLFPTLSHFLPSLATTEISTSPFPRFVNFGFIYDTVSLTRAIVWPLVWKWLFL